MDKKSLYRSLRAQAEALVGAERDPVANAANLSALVYHALEDVNWVGFYRMQDGELVVGPFQGMPACVRIAMGAGVCGTAAASGQTVVVDDVHAFDGHIACDPVSRSEIVVPLVKDDRLLGVLDVDSPIAARFDDEDRVGLQALAAVYVSSVD